MACVRGLDVNVRWVRLRVAQGRARTWKDVQGGALPAAGSRTFCIHSRSRVSSAHTCRLGTRVLPMAMRN
eukprot:1642220-Prymnesium_polylepis.1